MALPFLAGIAAGALAIVAWNKRDELKKYANESLSKGKKAANKIYAKGLKAADAAGEFVSEKLEKPKRKRRTRAQMAEARAQETAQKGKKSKKRTKTVAKKQPLSPTPAPIEPILATETV